MSSTKAGSAQQARGKVRRTGRAPDGRVEIVAALASGVVGQAAEHGADRCAVLLGGDDGAHERAGRLADGGDQAGQSDGQRLAGVHPGDHLREGGPQLRPGRVRPRGGSPPGG